jgi:outer membrane protein W
MKGPWPWASILVLTVSCLALQVEATQAEPMRGWYVSGSLGISRLDQEESRKPDADLGPHLGTAYGFRFDRSWALELESGYTYNYVPRQSTSGQNHVLSQVPLILNGVFHVANKSRFEPYLGAGFGPTVVWNETSVGGDATLVFKGGARHQINERMAIGLDYTFYMLGFLSAFVGEAVGTDTINLGVQWRL